MAMIAGLPGLIALLVCLRRGPGYAFLNVYLPVLLLLPDGYRMPMTGQLSFSESAAIPIAIFYLLEARKWRWSFNDAMVLAFSVLISISQFVNTDFLVAKNLALRMTVATILPYLMAKGLIDDDKTDVAVSKRIVVISVFVAIMSIYEFRMSANLFRSIVAPFFPEPPDQVPSFRYGMMRVAGPWSHPILAGVIYAIAFRLARWLRATNNWPGNVPMLPISKLRFCEIALLVGSVMTISRGPWLAAVVATASIMVLTSRHRMALAAALIFGVLAIGLLAHSDFASYIEVNPAAVGDEAQSSAAYRREMIEKYIAIAEERPNLGWGTSEFPIVDGMKSIDNHYLLLALNSGIYSLILFVLMLLWTPILLCRFYIRRHQDDSGRALSAALMSLFVIIAVSVTTAWLGAQTNNLLFLIIGWSEALLWARRPAQAKVAVPTRQVSFRFERVMV